MPTAPLSSLALKTSADKGSSSGKWPSPFTTPPVSPSSSSFSFLGSKLKTKKHHHHQHHHHRPPPHKHHHHHHHHHRHASPPPPPPPPAGDDAAAMLDQIIHLDAVDRLIAAMELLHLLEDKLFVETTSEDAHVRTKALAIKQRMQAPELKARLELVRKRGLQCKELLAQTVTTEGWTLVSEHNGAKSYFQPIVQGGDKKQKAMEDGFEEGADLESLIRVRVEGEVGCSPTEQLAAMREAAFYKTWMPLCQESQLLDRQGNADQIVWWALGIPGLFKWDILMQAWGADCMVEDGSVVIRGGSITHTDRVKDEDLPAPPKGWASWRIGLYQFSLKFKVTSPNTSHISVSFILDPKVRAKSLVNLSLKRGAALSLSFLRRFAESVVTDGDAHVLTPVMRDDPFYTSYLAKRLLWYIQQHFEGGGGKKGEEKEEDSVPAILRLLNVDVAEARAADPYPGLTIAAAGGDASSALGEKVEGKRLVEDDEDEKKKAMLKAGGDEWFSNEELFMESMGLPYSAYRPVEDEKEKEVVCKESCSGWVLDDELFMESMGLPVSTPSPFAVVLLLFALAAALKAVVTVGMEEL